MLGALVADKTGHGKTFTSVAAAMICKLLTEKVVMGLPLSILLGNNVEEWVNMVQNDVPGIIGEEREWYPLQPHSSVPHRLIEIQNTLAQGQLASTSALEPILVVVMPGVGETFKRVIDEMTYATAFKLNNLLHAENDNLAQENPNTSLDKPHNRWNMHLVSFHTFTSRAKPSGNGQLSHCSWSFVIFQKSCRYTTKDCIGWRIVMNARIGFKLQYTAIPGFHSLDDWCFQTMWLFSGVSEAPADDTVMDKHDTEAVYSGVNILIHSIRTKDEDTQQDDTQPMI